MMVLFQLQHKRGIGVDRTRVPMFGELRFPLPHRTSPGYVIGRHTCGPQVSSFFVA